MGKSSPQAPPAPNYTQAAQATSQGNIEAARAAANANRVNQYTPYGSSTYSHSGGDPDGGWSQTQSLAPQQQQLLDQQNKTSLGLGGLADRGLGYVNDSLSHNIGMGDLPASQVNPGQTGQDAMMARFNPMIDQQHKALDNQLANQGIPVGSEAYQNAYRSQNQGDNDLRSQAAMHGIQVGQDAQNQMFSLRSAMQDRPLNTLNALRTGSQVTNPTFGQYAHQGQTSGADYSGAAQANAQYGQGVYNSQVGAQNAHTSGMYALAGTAATVAF